MQAQSQAQLQARVAARSGALDEPQLSLRPGQRGDLALGLQQCEQLVLARAQLLAELGGQGIARGSDAQLITVELERDATREQLVEQ